MKRTNALPFGKLLWYDPNPSDNEPINLEDLTISVDLEVTQKTRSVIIVNNTTGTGQVSNNGQGKVKVINFFDGTKYSSPNSTSTRAVTTHYTDIQNLNGSIDDDYEALNIESINIEFNSSYAPMIKIKFVDIRGAAMFSNNGSGNYKFFFELPYPMFKLTIKGYYGKSVQYCLHLIRFNANFNSQTGNFEIDCDFIGFTYALLTDMLMGLVRASVTTTRGAAIFASIKGEYKNPEEVITVDDLTDKISEIDEKITKIKEGEAGIDISLSEKSRTEIENLRTIVLTLLDTYQSGQEKFTYDYKDGFLVISKPDASRNAVLEGALKDYNENVKKKINTDIKNIIGFDGGDPNIGTIKNALDPDMSGNNGGCKNFIDNSNLLILSSLKVDVINDDNKLLSALRAARYTDDTRLNEIADLLQNINYKGQKEVTIVDLTSAIKAINTSIAAIKVVNDEAVKTATDKLQTEIRGVLGFDPTIRNLFRVLCVSTETFLQCIYDVSREAELDSNGLRATELNKLGKDGLDYDKNSSKVFPWPEYRVRDKKFDGYEEEWIGNGKGVVVQNVPELKFTEELLTEMLKQKRKDKFREEELNGEAAWWPISVIDTPVEMPPNNKILINTNPYKIGLIEEHEKSATPKGTTDTALRIMMYRAFLLMGVVNRNAINPKLLTIHAKLEAENLYDALKQIPDTTISSKIKNDLSSSGLDNNNVYERFKTGTNLDVTGEKKPFFTEVLDTVTPSNSRVVYNYIKKAGSGRAYIPINGNFDGKIFYSEITKEIKEHATIKSHRDKDGCLFVNNVSNHTRTDSDITKSVVDAGTEGGINNNRLRNNFDPNDGAININIISAEKYNSYSLTPSFGSGVLNNGYDSSPVLEYNLLFNCVTNVTATNGYVNPIKSSPLLANTYDRMNYSVVGTFYSDYASDYYAGTDINDPKAGIGSTIPAFFNQVGSGVKNLYDTPYLAPKVQARSDVAFNGFALNYQLNNLKFGWEENTSLVKNGVFKASNIVYKDLHPEYQLYGHNRTVIAQSLNGSTISVPKIEFCVDIHHTYSLFGSKFYYYQNSTRPALNDSSTAVHTGVASRAFLFLHCFPFQGVTRVSDKVTDGFMFDTNTDKLKESYTYPSGKEPYILGLKGLFKLHNAFIAAPRMWTLFMGAILWRMRHYAQYTNANGDNDDPIQWINPATKGFLIPNMTKGIPRVDEFLSVVTDEGSYVSAGMNFNFVGKEVFGLNSYFYPFSYEWDKKEVLDVGCYSRIDETIMGLPVQVKDKLILDFLGWAGGEFSEIQAALEIKFNQGSAGSADYLTTNDGSNLSYQSKWLKLNNSYQLFPGSTTELGLKVDDIKNILGENIYDNYIMVAPISEGNTSVINSRIFETNPVGPDKDIQEKDIRKSIDTYITNQLAYNMQLRDDGPGMGLIRKLLTDVVYIQNVRPDVWDSPNLLTTGKSGQPSYLPINVNKENLLSFINSFLSHFKTISNDFEKTKQEEEDALQQALFNSLDDDKIKLNIYRTLASIFQKWVGGLTNTMFTQCGIYNPSDLTIAKHERNVAENPRLIDTFRFLDRSFNDIGDKFYINPQVFYNMITKNTNASFFDIVNKVLSDNNFNFIPLPAFVNFNDPKELADIFEPYPYNQNVVSGPSFVCVYAGQTSTNLDLGKDSNYPDDGIFISFDEKTKSIVGLPEDLNNATNLTPYETKLPVFAVNYGQQNQNYFKDVKLDQKEFAETAESLEIIDDISQGGDKMNNVMVGQNLFNVYQKRSYSCEVEMLGCALIQPMMYFQLNNIPMFRGLYLIINVSHSIKPNSMVTTFKGVRVKKAKTPLLSASDVLMTIVGDVSNVDTGNNTLGSTASNAESTVSKSRLKLVDYVKAHPITRVIEGNTIDTAKLTAAVNTAISDWDKGNITQGDNLAVLEKYAKRTAGPSGSQYSDGSQYWSAVFISYVMSEADSEFPKSSAHINYIVEAMNGKNGYEAFPLKNNLKIKPEVGDVVCYGRTGGGSHCDIVYKVDAAKAYLIGGNLTKTVQNSEDNNYPTPLLIGDGTADKGGSYYKGTIYDSGMYAILMKKTENTYYSNAQIGNTDNQLIIAKFLKGTSKLNKYQIAGVLGNIHVETAASFDPNSDNRADGSSVDYGIIHWNSGNWNDADCKLGSSNPNKAIGCIKSKVGETVEAQLNYLETKQSNFPTFKTNSSSFTNTDDTAYSFANIVEVCSGCTGTKAQFLASSAAKKRAAYAKTYLARMNDAADVLYYDRL